MQRAVRRAGGFVLTGLPVSSCGPSQNEGGQNWAQESCPALGNRRSHGRLRRLWLTFFIFFTLAAGRQRISYKLLQPRVLRFGNCRDAPATCNALLSSRRNCKDRQSSFCCRAAIRFRRWSPSQRHLARTRRKDHERNQQWRRSKAFCAAAGKANRTNRVAVGMKTLSICLFMFRGESLRETEDSERDSATASIGRQICTPTVHPNPWCGNASGS
jgi:hypothetical protein